jgi:hypothetical protein
LQRPIIVFAGAWIEFDLRRDHAENSLGAVVVGKGALEDHGLRMRHVLRGPHNSEPNLVGIMRDYDYVLLPVAGYIRLLGPAATPKSRGIGCVEV